MGGGGEDDAVDGGSEGFVEAEAAAVEDHLVDVGGAYAAVDARHAFVADDYGYAVEGAAVDAGLVGFVLEFALELHAGWRC